MADTKALERKFQLKLTRLGNCGDLLSTSLRLHLDR